MKTGEDRGREVAFRDQRLISRRTELLRRSDEKRKPRHAQSSQCICSLQTWRKPQHAQSSRMHLLGNTVVRGRVTLSCKVDRVVSNLIMLTVVFTSGAGKHALGAAAKLRQSGWLLESLQTIKRRNHVKTVGTNDSRSLHGDREPGRGQAR